MEVQNYKTFSKEWFEKLAQHISNGYIRVQQHPTKPLNIYNYTSKAQIEGVWDEVTRKCRGLVLDTSGNVIIECPEKFFNKGEPNAADIDWLNCSISEKLDGYYISFKIDYNYGMIITSRGSFDNQYVRAVHKFLDKIIVPKLKLNWTYFCELLEDFPGDEGIIVMRHPTPELVCWAIKDDLYKEHDPSESKALPFARRLTRKEMDKYLKDKVEGVVVRDDTTFARVKVKTDWFIKMHAIISNCTEKRVWENLRNGIKLEDLDIPDELYNQMRVWENGLRNKYFDEAHYIEDVKEETCNLTNKEIALNPHIEPRVKSYLFTLRKGDYKKLEEMIWKNIKP